jgi:hypothetical protein
VFLDITMVSHEVPVVRETPLTRAVHSMPELGSRPSFYNVVVAASKRNKSLLSVEE